MRLQLLLLGQADIDKGRVLTPGVDDGVWIRCPMWGGLVRTDGPTILFDTGLHPDHIADPATTWGTGPASATLRPVMVDADRAERRLAECGVRIADVDVVVNSHLHFDHCGQNVFFPRARFLVQRAHLAYVRGRANFPARYWDVPGLRYEEIDGELELARGVRVVPTPGHAPGHQSLVIDLPRTGRVVLTGDAAYTRENLVSGEMPAENAADARASIARLRELVGGKLERCFVSHDPEAWASWRHAPGSYE